MFFYVYVLQSKTKIYVGYTTDLRRRVEEHNKGQNLSTKAYLPWQLIYYEAHLSRVDTLRREKYLKTTQGRRTLRQMLKDHRIENQF